MLLHRFISLQQLRFLLNLRSECVVTVLRYLFDRLLVVLVVGGHVRDRLGRTAHHQVRVALIPLVDLLLAQLVQPVVNFDGGVGY